MGCTIAQCVWSYKRCKFSRAAATYRTNLFVPLTSLFSTFPMDLAGPLPRSKYGNSFLLVCVEGLKGWPLSKATSDATANVIRGFILPDILHTFGSTKTIMSDKASCFRATGMKPFLRARGIEWKTVLAYASMSSRIAEHMIGTLKKSLKNGDR